MGKEKVKTKKKSKAEASRRGTDAALDRERSAETEGDDFRTRTASTDTTSLSPRLSLIDKELHASARKQASTRRRRDGRVASANAAPDIDVQRRSSETDVGENGILRIHSKSNVRQSNGAPDSPDEVFAELDELLARVPKRLRSALVKRIASTARDGANASSGSSDDAGRQKVSVVACTQTTLELTTTIGAVDGGTNELESSSSSSLAASKRPLPLELLDLLGQGGAAKVYRGRTLCGGLVAVKVYPGVSTRYLDEYLTPVRRALALRHPNLLRSYSFAVASLDNSIWMSMELCDGSMRARLDTLRNGSEALSFREVLCCARDVAAALAFLHGKNFVHLDVKSENVFVAYERGAEGINVHKLGDFDEMCDVSGAPGSKANVGTPEFMAPEVIGKRSDDVVEYGCAADQWSYGMLLYELLTCEIPYRADADNVRGKPLSAAQVAERVQAGQRPSMFMHPTLKAEWRAQKLITLFERCTVLSPATRLPAIDVLVRLNDFLRTEQPSSADDSLRSNGNGAMAMPNGGSRRLSTGSTGSTSGDDLLSIMSARSGSSRNGMRLATLQEDGASLPLSQSMNVPASGKTKATGMEKARSNECLAVKAGGGGGFSLRMFDRKLGEL